MRNTFILFFLFCISTSNAQCWQFISAGDSHNLAIQADGTLWAWGYNATGQLGDGTYVDKNLPTQIGTDTNWVFASAGNNFSYAIKQNGTLYAWGNNNQGQLSDNTIIGRNTPLQVGTSTNWVKVSCGYDYVIAQKSDDSFWSCGENFSGQLAQGNVSSSYKLLTSITFSGNFITFKAGFRHVVLLKSNHTFWCWGEGINGKLATGGEDGFIVPTQPIPNTDWEQITSSHNGTLFKKINGTIWAVGQNTSGALGFGNYQQVNYAIQQISPDNDWRSIEDSKYCTMIIKNNGTLWSCGRNISGQQGNGNETQTNILGQVGTATNWNKVRCGLFYTIALTDSGTLMAWGENGNGQLGNGTFTNSLVPIQIGSTCLLSTSTFTKDNMKVYPNPVNSILNMDLTNEPIDFKNCIVTDVLGKEVLKTNITPFQVNQIDVSSLEKGFYLLQVTNGTISRNIKIIKN